MHEAQIYIKNIKKPKNQGCVVSQLKGGGVLPHSLGRV